MQNNYWISDDFRHKTHKFHETINWEQIAIYEYGTEANKFKTDL